jgi:peptidylamidoglycolate lyase
MHTNEYLFPHRQTRRDFLKFTGAATALVAADLALPGCATSRPAKPGARLGSGAHTYEVVEGWGQLYAGMSYGFGCGVVVDGQDRVYVTSRSANPAVAVFDRKGTLLEIWREDFAAKVSLTPAQVKDTAHCLYWSKEGRGEFFYWTENVSTNKEGPKLGKRVYKTDLKGRILYEIGNVAKEGSTAQKFEWMNPTDVAVAPNGDIYVVDGYGSQKVSRFDRNFKHLKTIGARGKEHGQFNTCHGIWVKTLNGREPEVYIADREGGRIEIFSLELDYKRTLKGDVRRPCCFYQHGGYLYVPDLASRVTILDADDKLAAQLGDGSEVPTGGMGVTKETAGQHPDRFFAPHAMCVDSHGDLYVVEWVSFGRPRKLKHTPQKA